MQRFISIDKKNIIVGIRYGKALAKGEIESKTGELGQIMQDNGTFIDSEPVLIEPQPSIEKEILFETKYQTMLLEMNTLL